MKNNLPLSKYYRIAEDISEKIHSGKYSVGSRIPGNRELVRQYGTTIATITSALRVLSERGEIESVRGSGIFVKNINVKKNIPLQKKNVASILPSGHFFDTISMIFSNNLYLTDEMIQLNHATILWDRFFTRDSKAAMKSISYLLEKGYDRLILQGDWFFPFKDFFKIKERFVQCATIALWETDFEIPGMNKILINWEAVGSLGARHLINNGHTNFILQLYSKKTHLQARYGFVLKREAAMYAGVVKEMLKHHLDPEKNLYISRNKNISTSFDQASLQKFKEGFTGIIMAADAEAQIVYEYCRENKIEIGKQLGIVGIYNTPWCEIFYPKLTSICLCEEQIGNELARIIKNDLRDENVLIQPELKIRKT